MVIYLLFIVQRLQQGIETKMISDYNLNYIMFYILIYKWKLTYPLNQLVDISVQYAF